MSDREYRPSPQQIERATAEIRAGWTEEEREQRRVGPDGSVVFLPMADPRLDLSNGGN